MAAQSSYIFSTLEKFSDGSNATLTSWLRKFERCCIITNKVDATGSNIKGQLLLLFVEGRARAILDEYETSEGGHPLSYVQLAAKLKEHFNDVSCKEHSMKLFETHMIKITESEEEFMLALVDLYTAANLTHCDDIKTEAVKRKFF